MMTALQRKGVLFLNIDDFAEILKIGESINTEFKSWNKVSDMKKRINLAVDELIAFANNKGGIPIS